MGRPKGNRTVTLELLVPDDLKSTICRVYGPRKYAWILERVAAAGASGDYYGLVYDLEAARIDRARVHAREQLLSVLRQRPAPARTTRFASLVYACGLDEDDYQWARRVADRLGIKPGRGAPVSDDDGVRLIDALARSR